MADENTGVTDPQLTDEEAIAADPNKVVPKEDDPKPDEQANEEGAKDTPQDPTDEVPTEYTKYEHPALKQAVSILEELKVPVAESNAWFAKAVEASDLSLIDRKAMTEKLGKDKADLVMVLAESYLTTKLAAFQKAEQEAHELVGGKESFDAMRDWARAKEKTDPAFAKEMADLREMISSEKPRAVKAALLELQTLWKADPNTTIPAKLEKGTSTNRQSGLEPLTRRQYTDAVQKAHRDGTYESQKATLWERRKAAPDYKSK